MIATEALMKFPKAIKATEVINRRGIKMTGGQRSRLAEIRILMAILNDRDVFRAVAREVYEKSITA